jgi:transcriptional regulator with GAF, ATPase, and Fis domain
MVMPEFDKQEGFRFVKPLVFSVLFALAVASVINYFVADHLDQEYQAQQSLEIQEVLNTGLATQGTINQSQDSLIASLLSQQQLLGTDFESYKSQNILYVSNQVNELFETINNYANTSLTVLTSFGGDVSGIYNNISVSNNSHNHTAP